MPSFYNLQNPRHAKILPKGSQEVLLGGQTSIVNRAFFLKIREDICQFQWQAALYIQWLSPRWITLYSDHWTQCLCSPCFRPSPLWLTTFSTCQTPVYSLARNSSVPSSSKLSWLSQAQLGRPSPKLFFLNPLDKTSANLDLQDHYFVPWSHLPGHELLEARTTPCLTWSEVCAAHPR